MEERALRVVFIWQSMTHLSGVRTCLTHLVQGLPEYGVDASIVELSQVEGPDRAGKAVLRGKVDEAGKGRWQTPYGYHNRVVSAVSRCRPDVVVFGDQIGWRYLRTFAGRVGTVNIVHIDESRADFWRLLEEEVDRLDALVGVSDRVCERLKGMAPAGVRVVNIPYGVAVSQERAKRPLPAVEGPTVLFAGRIEQRQKRVRDLVPFVKSLSGRCEKFRLVVIGDGPERRGLEEALREYGDWVSFLGIQPRETVLEHCRRSHYFFQCSEFEGLSLALLEAMAAGAVPVVTRIQSGVGQVLQEGENGFLFSIGDVDRAAELISGSLGRWEAMSRAAWRTMREGYSVSAMCGRYAALFREVGKRLEAVGVRYGDEEYTGLAGKVARRFLPIPIYCDLLRRVL